LVDTNSRSQKEIQTALQKKGNLIFGNLFQLWQIFLENKTRPSWRNSTPHTDVL